MPKVQISCPNCHQRYQTDLEEPRSVCEHCLHVIEFVATGGELGWVNYHENQLTTELIRPAAELKLRDVVESDPGLAGSARARRLARRQAKPVMRLLPVGMIFLCILGLILAVPFLTANAEGDRARGGLEKPNSTPSQEITAVVILSPTATPSPIPTATFTATPVPSATATATATATPLSPQQVWATQWQATLDGAVGTSVAMQTANAVHAEATTSAMWVIHTAWATYEIQTAEAGERP